MEHIVDKNTTEQFRSNYQRYGTYITFRRVMPDYRDGLKPVQRRILWAMYNDSGAVNRTVKCATIIGDVVGRYHPHSPDASYSTMKPMINWFENYITTIQGQGGFGNFHGDPASAYRYTEAKLSKFSLDCIIDEVRTSPRCIDWSPNFDNTVSEPEFLPIKVPLLLINGTFGIGLGKKTEIPSHNTNEVIDATIALMRDPSIDIVLVPDHCMKCEIVESDFATICHTGYGYYKVRGVIDVENYQGKTALVIKSTPNLVFLNDVIDKLEDLIEKKKLVQVAKVVDESTDVKMRYVIVLHPGADPNYVKDVIYKNTQMEHNERVNFEVLNGLDPIRMSYKSYLLSFIDHRMLTKFRVYKNRLQVVQTKIHEKEMYIKVLESGEVDNIIAYIRKQKTTDDGSLIDYLVKRLNITDLQAKFIIGTDLRKLSKGYLEKYKQEARDLEVEKEVYIDFITHSDLIAKEIIMELEDAKAKYGHPRNCRIVRDKKVNEIPKGLMTITITEKNFIKKVPHGTPIGSFKGDTLRAVMDADNTESIIVFDNLGRVFKLPVDKIPFVDRNSNGVDIRFLIKALTADMVNIIPESTIQVYGNKNNAKKFYILVLTKNGLIKKINATELGSIPVSGVLYSKLDEGDYVVSVQICDDTTTFIGFTDTKAMLIPVTTVSTMKRNAKGAKTFKSGQIDGIVPIDLLNCASIVTITNSGKFNKIPISSIPNINTPRKEFSVIKLAKGDTIQNILPVNEDTVVEVITVNGKRDIPVANLRIGSTISTGEKVLATRNDKIIRSY